MIQNVYFIGDSGYFRGFREIGRRFQIEHVLMPIGAYEPEWFMSPQHVSPEEAVDAYLELGAGYFIPMHDRCSSGRKCKVSVPTDIPALAPPDAPLPLPDEIHLG